MMVVIVVSRRVGQVTLAVSERTSCRNLNGLKAIVGVIRVVRRFTVLQNPNSPLAPSPLLKDEPASGLDVRGISKPRRISVKAGRQQVPLCTAHRAKGQGAGNPRVENASESAGIGSVKINGLAGRSGRARTCDPRFWRPVLYQLSYTPVRPCVAADLRRFKHRPRPDCKGEAD